jgi:hypothetical protein
VVAGTEAVLRVEPTRLVDLGQVEFHAETWLLRHLDMPAHDLQRLLRQALDVLQIQCVSTAVTRPGAKAPLFLP